MPESSHVQWSFIQQKAHLRLQPCTLDNTLNRPSSAGESFNEWFKERVYPEDMVNKKTKRAHESSSLGLSKTSERSVSGNCGTGVHLVLN